MRKFYYLFSAIAIAIFSILVVLPGDNTNKHRKISKAEQIQGAIDDMISTSRDIDLGYIPYDKLFKAIAEGNSRLEISTRNRMEGSLADAIWKERGPNNIGGRTRAIMIDESDPDRNRIWIGSVSGGVWRTEDITQADPAWEKLALEIDNLAVGSIAQDPNDFNVVYVGTGEGFPNIDAVTGAGIFKTTDDGATWAWLASTQNSNFQDIHEMYVHTNGDVYAGTQVGGLFRSKNGGNTWEKVLGTSLSGATSNNFFDFDYNETNQTFYASNANSVFKSTTGNRGDWTNIGTAKPGFPTDLVRVEMAVCATNPEVMYVLGSVGGSASNTFVSNDGGESWTSRSSPGEFPGQDFTNGQAWYDLEIAADPGNCGRILAGGVTMYESTFQGITWQFFQDVIDNTEFHPDQHNITFDTKKPGRAYFSNDGGIWMSDDDGRNLINKNLGYVTTQFYAAAIHPEAGSSYLLGGTQDNRSLQMVGPGLSSGEIVWPGDGMFAFIDQNEPDIQIVSSQFGNYGLSTDGGNNFFPATEVGGSFVNRSGYDDEANILYGEVTGSDFFRWNITTGVTENIDIAGQFISVSAVRADPNTPNRVYFGGQAGKVVRVENANIGSQVQGTLIGSFPGGAAVSSVYIDKQNADHILVGLFNFGSNLKNIHVTYDGGVEWNAIEGDLPDMPVRWAIFDPSDHDRVMIATEAGVWITDNVDGDLTHWEPIAPANGMPFVKVDMLVMRESDKVVLAATHGRGLFTTSVFSAAAPVILAQPIAYEGQPLIIDGSQSVNAESYQWNLGDNTTSNDPIVNHTYLGPGVYTISLLINGSLSKSQTIKILPYLPAPYQIGSSEYAGDFETKPEHFASYLVQGTDIQRGVSTKPGKDGTNSGASAWVLGINENLYQNNSRVELYTPMFDLGEPGLYELKFYGKYALQYANDGFQIEYSLDGGASWSQLGERDIPNWYNYFNTNIIDGAFPVGKSYFTNAQLNWTQYINDISFLAGQAAVSFRYVFRSDEIEQAQGLAIDDFEVTKYDGELKTTVTVFEAEYTGSQEVSVKWTTGIEYQCKKFILERSYTGFGFTSVAELSAKGIVSTFPNDYIRPDQNLRDIIYYRLKVINENPDINYSLEFYTDTIVVRRDVEADMVHNVLPNPFADRIGISFSSIVNQQVTFRLFDTSGKLVTEEVSIPNAVSYQLDQLSLPTGVYMLTVQIGDGETKAFKLFTTGQ